jgi:hypothetical protein
MSEETPTIETEIFSVLNSIVQKCGMIMADDQYSQKTKDDAKRVADKALSFALEETSPAKIDQLINQEIIKKAKKKMLEDMK